MILLLLIAGLLMIYAEFYLPGGILGLAGAGLLVSNIILFLGKTDDPLELALLVIASILGVWGTIRLALYRLSLGDESTSMVAEGSQEGFVASKFDEALIGQKATAVTTLSPSGYIKLDAKRLQVVSISGFVSKGAEVTIIGGKGAYLTVQATKTKEEL